MQYLTETLALNGVDLRRIYSYVCDYKDVNQDDYLLLITQCSSNWAGIPGTGDQYLRPQQNYDTFVTYTVGVAGYNLVKQEQTMGDILRVTLTYRKFANGNYIITYNT